MAHKFLLGVSVDVKKLDEEAAVSKVVKKIRNEWVSENIKSEKWKIKEKEKLHHGRCNKIGVVFVGLSHHKNKQIGAPKRAQNQTSCAIFENKNENLFPFLGKMA